MRGVADQRAVFALFGITVALYMVGSSLYMSTSPVDSLALLEASRDLEIFPCKNGSVPDMSKTVQTLETMISLLNTTLSTIKNPVIQSLAPSTDNHDESADSNSQHKEEENLIDPVMKTYYSKRKQILGDCDTDEVRPTAVTGI